MPADPTEVFRAVAALPGVDAAVERARVAVDDLRAHRVLRRYAERVSSESALRGARASAALEGVDLPLDVVRRTVTAGGRLPADGEAVVQGALRAAAEVGRLQGTWARSPLQALARLHAVAAAGLVPDEELGRPVPASSPRLQALAAALTGSATAARGSAPEPASTAAPALVVAAVVHAEVVTSGAFPVGGGLVARAAARLTLVGRGLDPAAVSAPEVGHLELGVGTYRAALDAYVTDGPEGVAAWVAHCADAVVLGAREGVAVCEAIQRGA